MWQWTCVTVDPNILLDGPKPDYFSKILPQLSHRFLHVQSKERSHCKRISFRLSVSFSIVHARIHKKKLIAVFTNSGFAHALHFYQNNMITINKTFCAYIYAWRKNKLTIYAYNLLFVYRYRYMKYITVLIANIV